MGKKIGIIGHFGIGHTFTDGQTVKTKEINTQIEKHYGITTDKFDTYKNSHNIFKLVSGIINLLKNNEIIILIVSERGYKIINNILPVINTKYNKRLFDIVIGGTRYNVYDKSKTQKRNALKFEKIYVETDRIKKEYNKRGLYNVSVLPNFKRLKIQKSKQYDNSKTLKLCTFSRIREEKGIEDAIKAVQIANSKIKNGKIKLCIYGKPDREYAEKFKTIISDLPEYITYGGLIDPSKSTEIINNYDAMLFLTYWKSEGFPGTLIDSLSSGVPVIATDWNCNFEVLKEDITGIKVKIKHPEEVAKVLEKLVNNKKWLQNMSNSCIAEANKYLPKNIMPLFYNQIDKGGI